MSFSKAPIILVFTIFLDQITKYLAKIFLPIHLNKGVSFGLLNQYPVVSLSISLILLVLIASVLIFKRSINQTNIAAFLLLLSGGISNTIDRVENSGAVVDWIKIWQLPVFNFADVAITSGLILLMLNLTINNKKS